MAELTEAVAAPAPESFVPCRLLPPIGESV
jgi:hypothetical protein